MREDERNILRQLGKPKFLKERNIVTPGLCSLSACPLPTAVSMLAECPSPSWAIHHSQFVAQPQRNPIVWHSHLLLFLSDV